MSTLVDYESQKIWKKLASLKSATDRSRKIALKKRMSKKHSITDLEYLLGAFIEMYEPHLVPIVHKFSEKGYALDPTSGFSGKFCELQTISGYFSVDYVTRNKLEKIGVKLREQNGSKALVFWPKTADIKDILVSWMKIIDILPDKGILAEPANSTYAVTFRRKFVPKDLTLQKKRLFQRLQYKTQKKIENDLAKRKAKNSRPNNMESRLGFFVEELQPQVRKAVLMMNGKGYSTDASGFMDNPCFQMIEGDFKLDEKTMEKIDALGVIVETNPSGYTRIQFEPKGADIPRIKRQWDKIVTMLPDKKRVADPSMTRKAREFREEYQ